MIGWNKKRNALENRLKKYPPTCPKCRKEMKLGYLRGFNIRWLEQGEDKLIYSWLTSIPNIIPSYLCDGCNLVIGQYKVESKDRKYENHSNEIFDYCPKCHYKLKLGFTFSNSRISWVKNKNISIGKTMSWSSRISPNKKLPTKKCSNCGLFFLRYK
ncbi:MAG: hypothetical protein KAS32_30785 [Candidatus Peribacteraceae bacterium]|nr:hypothetical protein [Candidatus Peribacteraceae bacterium]